MGISDLIFGTYTNLNRRRVRNILNKVNSYSESMKNITTSKSTTSINKNNRNIRCTEEEKAFYEKTEEFRSRLRNGETIKDVLPECLSVVREAIRRRLNMYPYDVQIEASIAMIGEAIGTSSEGEVRQRVIAEMKTGEGKTLVQILTAYVNAIEATKDEDSKNWKSVHIMTSNDALAKRDAENNSSVFSLLGLSSSFVPNNKSFKASTPAEAAIQRKKKQDAYMCDIVYATTSTIAFDYLNDNTIYNKRDRLINKKFGYAIIDEADDLLLDQATNPLILNNGSGFIKDENSLDIRDFYKWATEFLYGLERKRELTGRVVDRYEENKYLEFSEDYVIFLDSGDVFIHSNIEKELSKDTDDENIINMRYIALIDAIKAKHLYIKNKQYEVVVKDNVGKIILTDANTGRRKYSNKYTDGIQEAIEEKEAFLERVGKKRYVVERSKYLATMAMCTYPDFLSLYKGRVCGMTGTSDIKEFQEIYGFETYEVPSRKKNIRVDLPDRVYATKEEKYKAILDEVLNARKTLRPVLIGTTSILESIKISNMLEQNGISHQLLNAQNEEEENKIIENAGLLGMVSVSTNMAGRGTDIKLGQGVKEVGGLLVIGTSRNKSKRIDNQLRGRSARQGDPGESMYFSSLEDELVKLFYPADTLKGVIDLFKGKNKPIKTKIVDKVQERKESQDKENRINSEKFYKVFTEHKSIIYDMRNKIIDSDPKEFINIIKKVMSKYVDSIDMYSFDDVKSQLSLVCDIDDLYSINTKKYKFNVLNCIFEKFKSNFSKDNINNDIVSYTSIMRVRFLKIIDAYWVTHIETLNNLKNKYMYGKQYNDVFEDYEKSANEIFIKDVMPSLLNEMITYAVNKDMKFGEYDIQMYSKNKDSNKILV